MNRQPVAILLFHVSKAYEYELLEEQDKSDASRSEWIDLEACEAWTHRHRLYDDLIGGDRSTVDTTRHDEARNWLYSASKQTQKDTRCITSLESSSTLRSREEAVITTPLYTTHRFCNTSDFTPH